MIGVRYFVLILLLGFFPSESSNYCETPAQKSFSGLKAVSQLLNVSIPKQAKFSDSSLDSTANIKTSLESLNDQEKWLIIPSKRVGSFYLGMTLAQIKKVLPLGSSKKSHSPITMHARRMAESFAQGLQFFFDPISYELKEIKVTNQDYKTSEGTARGASLNQVEQNYTFKKNNKLLHSEGIAFEINNEKVYSIYIF